MNGKRIALIHSFYGSSQPSGENRVVESEAAALTRAGHTVELMGAHTDALEGEPFFKSRAAVRTALGVGRSPILDIDRFQPDIVHVHNLFPNFGTSWLRRLDGVPLVVTLHNYRLACANGLLYRDGEICTRCITGKPWSGVRYGCYRESRAASLPLAIANRRGAAHHPLVSRADKVIVLSAFARQLLEGLGVPAAKLVEWPNFLPTDLDPAVTGGAESQAPAGWLFVGRLSEEKGIMHLIERWPSRQRLTVVGSGPLEPMVRAAAHRQPEIEFVGQVSRQEVVSLMKRSLGLVFPSRWYETFGLVQLEAMSAGLPTLAFEPTVVADRVRTEGTGMAVRWDADLEAALNVAAARFPTMREGCRRAFERLYTESLYINRAEALYEDLTASASARSHTHALGLGDGVGSGAEAQRSSAAGGGLVG